MRKIGISVILLVAALTLVAQPVLASVSPANQATTTVLQAPTGGVTKIVKYWWGFQLYLSQSTCMWLGAGVSLSSISAFLLSVAGASLVFAWLPAVALALSFGGAAILTVASINHKGVILTFSWLPLPPTIRSQ